MASAQCPSRVNRTLLRKTFFSVFDECARNLDLVHIDDGVPPALVRQFLVIIMIGRRFYCSDLAALVGYTHI